MTHEIAGSPVLRLSFALLTFFLGALFVGAVYESGRRSGLRLPLAALVGYQGFRVVVELLLHRAYVEGLMPVQMSYSGLLTRPGSGCPR
jgi:hypothetical protein